MTYAEILKATSSLTATENGATCHSTSGSDLLDLFALGGSYRSRSDADCIELFAKALDENEAYAMKCLFYLSDCRGGQGERRFFRVCYNWLAKNHPEIARRNMRQIPFYRRWDDLYCLVNTPLETEMFQFMKEQLALDVQSQTPSLLAKWLKSINASSSETRILGHKTREAFGMTPKQYRKTLSVLRQRINILERLMSEGHWDEIVYDAIPSHAGLRYRNAFARHDAERYKEFLENKENKVNALLDPVNIAHYIFSNRALYKVDLLSLDKYWQNLPDYYNGREENGIAVVDVSGSMTGLPMEAAVSMGTYIAERGKGPYKDHFITFSNCPQMVEIKGKNIVEKFKNMEHADWGMSTNVEAVMDLLLNVAIRNKCPQSEIPTRVYILSDMEFNSAMRVDNYSALFEAIDDKWRAAGYEMPEIVFWNLDARNDQIPAIGGKFSYLSGFSMTALKAVLSGKTGQDLMMETLDSDRYNAIH